MKTKTFLALSLITAVNLFAADDKSSPQAEVEKAAKALAGKANYSWTTKVENNADGGGGGAGRFRMGPVDGKVSKGGPIVVSTKFGDAEIEMIKQGEKGAMKREGEWKSAAEIESDGQRGEFMARRILGLQTPAKDAEEFADLTSGLKKGDDGTYAGALTKEGIKEVMGRGGRAPANLPDDSKGTVKFWVKDGVLSKFEYNVKTTVTRGENEIKVDRTTTTEIKDVGTTKIELSDEAKKKLE